MVPFTVPRILDKRMHHCCLRHSSFLQSFRIPLVAAYVLRNILPLPFAAKKCFNCSAEELASRLSASLPLRLDLG